MLACALGDVHAAQHMAELQRGRQRLGECDLLLLAGDITDNNDLDAYGRVLGALREMCDGEIVAVFGNEEYEASRPDYRSRYRITFLEEEAKTLEMEGLRLRIVGSTGTLDRPTWWQRSNVPDIWSRYSLRNSMISELLVRQGADVLVLLTHYAPTYATLEGERPASWPEMGSRSLESLVLDNPPDLAIHAHAHRGRPRATLVKRQRSLEDFGKGVAEVPVLNASLPATGKPVFFDIGKKGEIVVLD